MGEARNKPATIVAAGAACVLIVVLNLVLLVLTFTG